MVVLAWSSSLSQSGRSQWVSFHFALWVQATARPEAGGRRDQAEVRIGCLSQVSSQ